MCVTHICVVTCVSHTYALSHVCHTHMRCHMCASNYIYDVGRCLCVRPSYPLSRVTYMCVTHICVVICVPATIYVKLVGAHVLCHRTYSVVSHICVSYTYMCVSHTYELSCVPATIYMLVGAHVLCHRTHLVVSHICVSHTYMCVTHIWVVECVPAIIYVQHTATHCNSVLHCNTLLVGASVLWYQLSHAIYMTRFYSITSLFDQKNLERDLCVWKETYEMVPEPRGACFFVSNLRVIESRCRFRHSPRSHIGDVLWNSEPDLYRQFSQCFWSALLVLRKMRFDTKVLERPTQKTPRKGPLLCWYHVTKWLSVIYIHHGDIVWDGYDQ